MYCYRSGIIMVVRWCQVVALPQPRAARAASQLALATPHLHLLGRPQQSLCHQEERRIALHDPGLPTSYVMTLIVDAQEENGMLFSHFFLSFTTKARAKSCTVCELICYLCVILNVLLRSYA